MATSRMGTLGEGWCSQRSPASGCEAKEVQAESHPQVPMPHLPSTILSMNLASLPLAMACSFKITRSRSRAAVGTTSFER